MKYFSYGSNMCLSRMKARVNSAITYDIGKVVGYELRFHSLGHKDGSGKVNLIRSEDPNSVVYGVIYEVESRQRHLLDKEEGLGFGFNEALVKVRTGLGDVIAFTYIAHQDIIDDALRPFSWYRDLVVAGAQAHGLPSDYVEFLKLIEARQDQDKYRHELHRRFLRDAG